MAKKLNWIRTGIIGTSLLVVIFVAVRLWLPAYLQEQISTQFKSLANHNILYADIEIAYLKNAFSINRITITEKQKKDSLPCFTAKKITYSLDWTGIFHGTLVSNIEVFEPELNIRYGSKAAPSLQSDSSWQTVIADLIPFKINGFKVSKGKLSYLDTSASPSVKLILTDVEILGSNIQNLNQKETLLPAEVSGSGKIFDGIFNLHLNINPLQKMPMFEMKAEMSAITLSHLNDLLKSYVNIEAQTGTIAISATLKSSGKLVHGNVKTLMDSTALSPQAETNFEKALAQEQTFQLISWQTGKKNNAELIYDGKIENYKGNMWNLVTQTLHYTFLHSVISTVAYSFESSQMAKNINTKSNKSKLETNTKEKPKNFLQRLFSKKEGRKKIKSKR